MSATQNGSGDASDALAYRPDVDGLRAIAVLSVVIFHAFPQSLRGGFIGVDIFFVISGFLISSIILSGLSHGRFSLPAFYIRRIRRIFPALLAVMATVFALGWFLLFSHELAHVGQHIASAAAFILNFVLWQDNGYFAAAAEKKPLLHLWSLSVEEQFYVIWPALLAFAWKKEWNIFAVMGTIFAASFLINIYDAGKDPLADFYSPLPRFWEFMAGGLLACADRRALFSGHTLFTSGRGRDLRAGLGLLLLVAGLLTIHDLRAFPGAWGLFPVLGTALIISAGPEAWLNKKFLSHRALVGLGLISYPVYLWHWPLLSLVRITKGPLTTPQECFLIVLVSLLLGWITYERIEKPLRFGKNGGVTAAALLALMMVFGAAGWATHHNNGFIWRAAAQAGLPFDATFGSPSYASCRDEKPFSGLPFGYCDYSGSFDQVNAALLGDSHAKDKFNGLINADKRRSWVLIGHNGCPPVYGPPIAGIPEDCRAMAEAALDWVSQNDSIKTVILSFYSNHLSSGAPAGERDVLFSGLDNAVSRLLAAQKNVILLIDVPRLVFQPSDCVRGNARCAVTRKAVAAQQAAQRDILSQIKKRHPKIFVYDPLPMFCDNLACDYKNGGTVLYYDTHHLSPAWSDMYAKNFLGWFDRKTTK